MAAVMRRSLAFLGRRAMSTEACLGSSAPVGFIGLGQMGERMARNMARAGRSLVINDLNAAAVQRLSAEFESVTVASSPADVASQTSTIVTMLPANAMKSGSLLIDASTVDPIFAGRIAAQATAFGANMVDAPVSGGVGGAEAGTLTFMVGADKAHFEAARPLLALMGKNIVHCGPNGTGQVAKICNNMLLAIGMIGTAEAMALGKKLGMDPKVLAGIINTSSGRCWSSDTYNPCPGVLEGVPASRNYEGGFASKLMAKDLRLAMAAATEVQSSVPLGALASQLYNVHCGNETSAGKDFGSIFELLSAAKTK